MAIDEIKDAMMRSADILARRLYDMGCRFAFGMPGGEVLTVVDALEKAGIRFVLCHHENAAGFMAEGVHHQNGAPGILVATLGPGVLNAVNVIANAYQDRVPLIVLSGCVDEHEESGYTHQILDHSAVLAPITKGSFRLNTKAVNEIADKALLIAMNGRQGPVHIDVPMSVADERADERFMRPAPLAPVVPAAAVLKEAAQWVQEAQRPVMIVGLDVLKDQSAQSVQRFAETYQCPVITTYKAKGVLPEDHPLSMGGAGLSPLADQSLISLIQDADLVLCIGYDPIEMRRGWQNIWSPQDVRVIDVSAELNQHFMHQSSMSIAADTGATLDAILPLANAHPVWPCGMPQQVKRRLQNAFTPSSNWGPAQVIDLCQQLLPKQTIATADSGAHRILLSQMWACSQPKGLLQSSGLCTMGCALPLASGVKLANPELPVIAFMGDAGFLMVAGELATVARLELTPIFVVFVDRSLGLIELKQRQREMTNLGVDFPSHDFTGVARALGGQAFDVSNADELRFALGAAQNAQSFTLIAAHIDRKAYDDLI